MKTLRYSFLIHIYHDFFFFENKKKTIRKKKTKKETFEVCFDFQGLILR